MSPLQIKEQVKQAYPYKTWWIKVDKMSDAQIYATYLRLKAQNKL